MFGLLEDEVEISANGDKVQYRTVREKWVDITPEMATIWLELNYCNRHISAGAVDAYARDMKRGLWKINSATIAFDKEGRLRDGQHRLCAIVKSGVTIRCLVVWGLDVDAVQTMDRGRKRSAADALRMDGHVSTNVLAAAARLLIGVRDHPDNPTRYRATDSEIREFVKKHPLLPQATEIARSGKVVEIDGSGFGDGIQRLVAPHGSVLVALYHIGHNIMDMQNTANRFAHVFRHGVPAYQGCPAHGLRERIMAENSSKTVVRSDVQWYSTVKAWNLFAKNMRVSKTRLYDSVVHVDGLDRGML